MTKHITKAERKKLRELEGRATPGPWHAEDVSEQDTRPTGWALCIRGGFPLVMSHEDPDPKASAFFLAEARNQSLPLLDSLDEAARLLRRSISAGGAAA